MEDMFGAMQDGNKVLEESAKQFKSYAEIVDSATKNANQWDLNALKIKYLGRQFLDLMDIQNRTVEQQLRYENLLKQIDQSMPGFEKKVNDLTDAHLLEREEIERLIQSYIRLAEVRAKMTAYGDIQADIYKNQYALKYLRSLCNNRSP